METVLTIAGSDTLSGGGMQADLKTFEELDVFGVCALTGIVNVTSTDTKQTLFSPNLLADQIDSILTQLPIQFVKTGLLGDFNNLLVVVNKLMNTEIKLVIDPVLFFKEGQLNFHKIYGDSIKSLLMPLGFLTTPNLREAAYLSDIPQISTKSQVQLAARKIQSFGCPNVVIKCGSEFPGDIAYNYLLNGDESHWITTPKLQTVATDGAGCTFSAAITALLAQGYPLLDSVRIATEFVYIGIQRGLTITKDLGNVWQGAYRQKVVTANERK
ncbi:hydroxymethylpyrimidine/phosphomethylpyrimidine kinase [Levilactobacillus cerevisiae]|uniref:hydroxymethylpyrimidine/phosphomethylpyrimidine kinase n=1 Tax=Levilactobacillus cerevisiae TaxID=1704076 RepID=UPI000F777E08|nr:hydroxymethylpyrimidine/phosphomethylpyrimidine kinase [Levilactobacillus cerevisiae]